MAKKIRMQIAGQKFGRLTVLEFADMVKSKRGSRSRWKCICECGNIAVVDGGSLRSGNTSSCGCLHLENLTKPRKHGYAHRKAVRPEFRMWTWASHRAKVSGVPFTIEVSDIVIPKRCPVFGIELKPGTRAHHPHSPSLDRIIPSLGYVKGNIWVISHHANAIKRNATLGELEYLVRALKEKLQLQAVA